MKSRNFNGLIPELSVKNFDRSINFYVNILGFKIEYARENDKFAMISINSSQIMIEEINGYWETGKLEYPFGRGINIQIEVNNVETMAGKLNKNNIKLFREIEENWYNVNNKKHGNKEFLVQDPDGYLLRFAEDLGVKNDPH